MSHRDAAVPSSCRGRCVRATGLCTDAAGSTTPGDRGPRPADRAPRGVGGGLRPGAQPPGRHRLRHRRRPRRGRRRGLGLLAPTSRVGRSSPCRRRGLPRPLRPDDARRPHPLRRARDAGVPSPAERAVWVLHEMFELPFTEVATIVGRTQAAVRQLASRARHVGAHVDRRAHLPGRPRARSAKLARAVRRHPTSRSPVTVAWPHERPGRSRPSGRGRPGSD
jgi:hypothetical protein